MAADDVIRMVRTRVQQLPYESPTRGAIALTRLGYGMPTSETVKGLTAAQVAHAIVQRTIRHSHRARWSPDQYGNGSIVMFWRHVHEGDKRWDFEVDVTVDRAGAAAISDVRVVRPGDDIADPDDPEAEPVEPRAPIADPDLLPHGMLGCPCCGHATLSERAMYLICPVCFWEDDGQDDADAGEQRGGPNKVSLAQGRANYRAFGASYEGDRPHVRAPTREEVKLRTV